MIVEILGILTHSFCVYGPEYFNFVEVILLFKCYSINIVSFFLLIFGDEIIIVNKWLKYHAFRVRFELF